MQAEIKLALVQTSLVWENVSANLRLLEEKIKSISGAEIVVLPEMFTTGFSMNTSLAQKTDGETVLWMLQMAKSQNVVVCGSLMIEENNSFFNKLFWVQPNGAIFCYIKRHLFSLSDEPKHFSQGTKRLIVEYKGWRFCPLICYDLRFPVWSRNRSNFDVLIYVANWPQKRNNAWKTLLPARAIENQCYVVAVNRVGADGNNVQHSGDSVAYDALGNQLTSINPNEEAIEIVTLHSSDLLDVRQKFPFLNDADSFHLNV